MGRIHQRRQNIRSTLKAPIADVPPADTDLGTKTHLVHSVLVDQGQLYTDLTEKLPVRPRKGNSYVMVCYVYDCNYVRVIPMKYRSASEWVKAYDHIHQELTVKGIKPKLQNLDNEASATLKNLFTANNVEYQLVPPHCHRRNAAERAIRTFKEHFVAGLSSVDPTFPLHLWYRLSPQTETTLNILRTLRLHPQLSAAAHFHGLVDYNKTTFSPPGCKIIALEKPGKRRTWAPHRQHGYSLVPAMHHYRCQHVYISSTASEIIVDTLEFFTHNYQMSQLSSIDRLLMAAKNMMDALQNPHPKVSFTHIREDTISALIELVEIFKLSHPSRCASRGQTTHMPRRIIQSNVIFSHALPRQTRSQTTLHARDITNSPLLPRVVTQMTRSQSPPRVATRSRNLCPHNLSQ
jgi:hypothetical protein